MRKKALKWWNGMNIQGQTLVLIKNHIDRHPHTLTGLEIEKLYKIKQESVTFCVQCTYK